MPLFPGNACPIPRPQLPLAATVGQTWNLYYSPVALGKPENSYLQSSHL